jgi:hypothetical protein
MNISSNDEVTQMNERTQSTINNINNLQSLEKDLYSSIENAASSPNPPSIEQQKQSIKRINELSGMRGTLFGNLKDMYSMNKYQVSQTKNDLVDELTTIKVIEGELNNSKQIMNSLKREKQDKLRMVEINTYYGQRYEAHINIIKFIIMVCIPVLLITVLNKKNFISSNIANIIMSIVIGIACIILFYKVYDLMFRDNMNYSQYQWKFDPTKVDLSGTANVVDLPQALDFGIQCVGDACCPGDNMSYDSDKNICVLKASANATSDSTTGSSSDVANTNVSDTVMMTKEAFSSCDSYLKLKGGVSIEPYDENGNNFVKI